MNNQQFYQCVLCNHNYQQLYNLKQHTISHLENAINRRNSADLGVMVNTLNNQGRHLDITNFQNYYQMINRLQMSNNINVQEYFNTHARTILVFLRAPDNGVIIAPPPPPLYEHAVNHHPGQPTPPPPIGQPNQLLQEQEQQAPPILVEEAAAAGNIEFNIQDLYNMRDQYLNQIQDYDYEYDLINLAQQPPILNNVYDNDRILQAAMNEIVPQIFADQVPHQQQQQVEQEIAFNAAPPTPAQPDQRILVEQIHAPTAAAVVVAPPPVQQQQVLVLSESPYGRFDQLPQQRTRYHPYINKNIRKNDRRTEYVSIDEVVKVTSPDGTISNTHRVIHKTIVQR
jgi:hypothetical protein